MDELINVIEELGRKDFLDIVAAFSPIILSVIAIVISIYVARKQNKIAMFDMRYEAMFRLKTVLSFAVSIEKIDDPKIAVALFDGYFGCDILNCSDRGNAVIKARAEVETIKKDLLMIGFLFEGKYNTKIQNIIILLQSFMMSATKGDINTDDLNLFVKSSKDFYDKDFGKLCRKTRL